MKCLTHKEADAVAVCVHCGRALCDSCTTRSDSGRLVCSPGWAAASKQLEDFIASTRHKSVRGARVTGYFLYGIAAVFGVSAVFFYFDGVPVLTGFVGVCAIAFAITGFGYMRVAKRNTEHGAV